MTKNNRIIFVTVNSETNKLRISRGCISADEISLNVLSGMSAKNLINSYRKYFDDVEKELDELKNMDGVKFYFPGFDNK